VSEVSSLVLPHDEPKSTSTLPEQPGVLVVRKHHFLVRWSHWLNLPILLGLILSGISIYWASPIYQHKPDPNTGNFDMAADIGIWICAHVPGLHQYNSPPDWIYNHMSLGPGMLALALRLHWLCAYLFTLNGIVYVAGLAMGGDWRSLLPRRTDLLDALRMFRYYLGFSFAKLARREWPHPVFNTKYNALQRAAYFSVPVTGSFSVATGWAIHKPMQLHWLAAIFGGYNAARVGHFWLMWLYIFFVVPHVFLVFADGWDTLRSMIVGWSTESSGRRSSQMNHKENVDDSVEPKDKPSTGIGPKPEIVKSAAAGPEGANPPAPVAIENEKPETVEAKEQSADADESPSPLVDRKPQTDHPAASVAPKSVSVKKPQSFFAERPLPAIEIAPGSCIIRAGATFWCLGLAL
jgi:thiosulfate reductase cytochrome b subunit